MQKKYLFIIISTVFIVACNNEPEQEKKKTIVPDNVTIPVYKMDLLEKIFTNDNWMKIDNQDTSYYYFSRISTATNVYHYRISKGDSVNTSLSVIQFSTDSLIWPVNDSMRFILRSINEKEVKWNRMGSVSDSSFMVFEKKDDKHIQLTLAGNKKFLLIKTPALATFLVRSRYDYLHGTDYAFSDTVFKVKTKKRQLISTGD